LSVAEPRRIARLNTDAGDGVAYLLLPRLTLCLCFNAPFADGLHRSARWGPVGLRLRLCANRKCKRDCDDECSPHFSSRVSTVEMSLDGKPVR
jgi:hypothetical protein